MKPTLLLVDIQNDNFPGGKMEMEDMPLTALQAQKLLLQTPPQMFNWHIWLP